MDEYDAFTPNQPVAALSSSAAVLPADSGQRMQHLPSLQQRPPDPQQQPIDEEAEGPDGQEFDLGDDVDFELEVDEVDEEALVRDRRSRSERIARLQERLHKELKMKEGADIMLALYNNNQQPDPVAMRATKQQVDSCTEKIDAITREINELKSSDPAAPKVTTTTSALSRAGSSRGLAESGGSGVSLRKATSVNATSESWRRRLSHFRAETGTFATHRRRPGFNVMKGVIANITDALKSITAMQASPQNRLDGVNNLIKILRSAGKIDTLPCFDEIMRTSLQCLSDKVQEIRASGFRIIRYCIAERQTARKAWSYNIDLFIIRALTKDGAKNEVEREQAVRLIRAFIDCPHGTMHLPYSMPSILVSIAESSDDKLRVVALETLCELALRDVDAVAACSGLKVIFQALFEGPKGLVDFIVPTITTLLDRPETRRYLKPAVDVEMVIANFTDTYNRGQSSEEKLMCGSRAIAGLLSSWSGLYYFCMDDRRSFRCLVESLRLPVEDVQRVILDMLFAIFRLSVPKWLPDIISSRAVPLHYQVSTITSVDEPNSSTNDDEYGPAPGPGERSNLLDHQRSLLLMIFVDCGLLEALVELVESSNRHIVSIVIVFIGEIIDLANRILPASYCSRVQALANLFGVASAFRDESARNRATTALLQIERVQAHKKAHLKQQEERASGHHSNSKINTYKQQFSHHSPKTLDDIKFRLGLQIDDLHFRSMLMDSQVLTLKDYTKWNWDLIAELLDGPMINPRRLEEIMRSTKFFKRLLAFYCPLKYRFSNIKPSKTNYRYVTTGCTLFKTLLSSVEGAKFLTEHKLLHQIVDCLTELEPINGMPPSEPMFSRDRMEKTLTGEYFTLIGSLCIYKEGLELMEKAKVFNLFYHLTELRSRDDLIKTIITCMDYSMDGGHTHIILSKVMTSGYKHIRLFATNHLRHIMRSARSIESFSTWGISLLITQLYDPSLEVCERAVMVLDEACRSKLNLDMLVSLKPSLDHLGEIGDPLLFRFLATPSGFDYLQEIEYTEQEIDFWVREGNCRFVVQQEIILSRLLNLPVEPAASSDKRISADDKTTKDVRLQESALPHFFGELTRTAAGCELLRRSEHLSNFVLTLTAHVDNVADPASIVKLKGSIWAIGHIGSSAEGLKMLEDIEIVPLLIQIAETSAVLSVKATCYYALGLISRNADGAALLEDYGWESVVRSSGYNGLAIPKKSAAFLSIPHWQTKNPHYERIESSVFESDDQDVRDLFKNIGSMSNHILAKAASKALTRMKTDRADLLCSFDVYGKVLKITSVYHYRMTARRFLQDLFEGVDITDKTASKISAIDERILKQSSYKSGLLASAFAPISSSNSAPKPPVAIRSSDKLDGMAAAQRIMDRTMEASQRDKRSEALVVREGFTAS